MTQQSVTCLLSGKLYAAVIYTSRLCDPSQRKTSQEFAQTLYVNRIHWGKQPYQVVYECCEHRKYMNTICESETQPYQMSDAIWKVTVAVWWHSFSHRWAPMIAHWSSCGVQHIARYTCILAIDYHNSLPVTIEYHNSLPVTIEYHNSLPVTIDYHNSLPVTIEYHNSLPVTIEYHNSLPVTMDYHNSLPPLRSINTTPSPLRLTITTPSHLRHISRTRIWMHKQSSIYCQNRVD